MYHSGIRICHFCHSLRMKDKSVVIRLLPQQMEYNNSIYRLALLCENKLFLAWTAVLCTQTGFFVPLSGSLSYLKWNTLSKTLSLNLNSYQCSCCSTERWIDIGDSHFHDYLLTFNEFGVAFDVVVWCCSVLSLPLLTADLGVKMCFCLLLRCNFWNLSSDYFVDLIVLL